jgi:type III restriction enzyme
MLSRPKYQIPKYALKMATGTGKTWVMNAIVIWQYLNAKAEDEVSGRFGTNFLLVAPGLIVYERLLDSYLGKESSDGSRDFETSDIFKNRELFLPEHYRDAIFGFLQSSVVKKDEIGRKITGGGMVAISNWHLFMDKDEEAEDESIGGAVAELFPIRPGTSGGNTLENLDNAYLGGGSLEYLANLENLVVINDEAHHIHENKTAGIVEEVEWQKALDKIAANKGARFVQFDFSATPYDITGSGQNRTKHFFPHTIVNFGLDTAIKNGLVKMIAIDKREEWASSELDFRAIRDDANKVIGISDGQKLMLEAGLKKLQILEESFVKAANNKHPKMLVMCEDTAVVPFVEEYLKDIGLNEDEFVGIHSDKKGKLSDTEWQSLKQKVFNIDGLENPKVIISVLMLREGFDVSNICVIVPLRSSQAPILLEQTIGRGLRLMWREAEFTSLKAENRERLLVQKLEPLNYLDLLSIIEHPAFVEFYADLEELLGGTLPELDGGNSGGAVTGDILNIGLKENYERYDLYWPKIISDEEETLDDFTLDGSKLAPLAYYSLEQLKSFTPKGENFHSQEITTETVFGKYQIGVDFFKAKSYNEYLQKLLAIITNKLDRLSPRGHFKPLPNMQTNLPKLIGTIDEYIRNRLFGKPFNPFEDENWRILMLKTGGVSEFIIKEVSSLVYETQQNTIKTDAVIQKIKFSSIDKLTIRENYSLELTKTIYERTGYPTNKGEFEKDFLLFLNTQSAIEAFIKIVEFKHTFAVVPYIRTDGLMAHYSPDFLVRTAGKIYIVETKADKDVMDANVRQKQKATLGFIAQINALAPENRDGLEWEYLLLSDAKFYLMSKNGADFEDIAKTAHISRSLMSGNLFDLQIP